MKLTQLFIMCELYKVVIIFKVRLEL